MSRRHSIFAKHGGRAKTYEGNNWIIELHADGSVTNTDGPNRYPKSGFWRAKGNFLNFDLNQKYYDFKATLKGDELPGDSSNVTGLKWKTTFRRMPPMAVPPMAVPPIAVPPK